MHAPTRSIHPLLALAAAAALVASAPAHAGPWPFGDGFACDPHTLVQGNAIDVQVRVDGGTAPLYFRPGALDRHYFQAFEGRNYSLFVRNRTGQRIAVLIAVDGLNVVNGLRSNLDRHEQMYVLDPYESAEIQGWRTSLDDVRRFVFVDERHSYAARSGQANGDMGWIRVQAYREVVRWPGWGVRTTPSPCPPAERREMGADGAAPQAGNEAARPQSAPPAAGQPTQELQAGRVAPEAKSLARDDAGAAPGTGWGDRRYDPVQETSCEPQPWAADRITLRYEYAAGLRALDIEPRRERVFERERGELGFAPPPRW